MADEVIPGTEQTRHELRVLLEVDALDRRIRWEAGPVENDDAEPLPERKLPAPGRTAADNASVDEHEPLHSAILRKGSDSTGLTPGRRCNEVGLILLKKAGARCYKLADMLRPG